ncbi:hypothetical protein [Novipirellula caenicola]|uniref:Transmembrane protein n=1 Tax=Novipirellula caenicola TaxID=1536901 RepID=A0ABP9VPB2_9BACT
MSDTTPSRGFIGTTGREGLVIPADTLRKNFPVNIKNCYHRPSPGPPLYQGPSSPVKQAGEVSITEKAVVDMSHLPAADCESVRNLLLRLGPPPTDIAQLWCEQARAIADDIASRTGQPLPPIDLADWLVDEHGTVGVRASPSTRDQSAAVDSVSPKSVADVDTINQQRLADFRNQIRGGITLPPTTHDQPTAFGSLRSSEDAADDDTERYLAIEQHCLPIENCDEADVALSATEPNQRRRRRSASPERLAVAAAIAIVVLGSSWWLASRSSFLAGAPNDISPDTNSSNTKSSGPSDATGSNSRGRSSAAVASGSASNALETLPAQTLESFSMTDPSLDAEPSLPDSLLPDSSLADASLRVPFDSLVPEMIPSSLETSPAFGDAAAVSSKLDSEAELTERTAVDGSSLPVLGGENDEATVDALATHPETEAPESPQRVRTVKVQSLQLPAVQQTAVTQPIGDWPANDAVLDRLSLEFPLPIPIAMKRSPAASGHPDAVLDLHDTRSETLLASFCRDSAGLAFQWHETAKSSSQSGLLLHGRLRDATGNVIYFRPRIEADPWPLSFDQSDFHPSWELGGLLPAKVARLVIEFELPEEIEEAWIEPIDSASPRRTSGIAVLTLKDNENVRVGLRFDVKCTTKLACQIRIAGRLDPGFAWQTFTETGLANFANTLLGQADLAEQQIANVEAIYDRAGTDARRILRPRRTAIKSHAEQLAELSRRIAELQSLVALLQTSAKLRFHVSVQWSDGEQIILTQKE